MVTVVMVTVTIGWFFDVFHWRGDRIFFIKRAAALGTDHITLEQTNKRNVYRAVLLRFSDLKTRRIILEIETLGYLDSKLLPMVSIL